MNTSFIFPSAEQGDAATKRSSGAAADPPAVMPDHGDRACCCPAKAVVQVVMPPTATRPHATDLLLCGHHYRVTRPALVAAHAVVHDLPGVPRDTAAWIYDDYDRSLARAKCGNLSAR